MSNGLIGILIALAAVGVALIGVILTTSRGLRQDMAQMETRLRVDTSQLRTELIGDIKQLGDRVARLIALCPLPRNSSAGPGRGMPGGPHFLEKDWSFVGLAIK